MKHDRLILPREVEIGGRTFAVSKIPALQAIDIYNSIADSVNRNGVIGMSMLPQSTVRQILGYVNLFDGNDWLEFTTESAINEIFKNDFGALQEVIVEMEKENFDFFVSGRLLERLAEETRTPAATESD